MKKSIDERNIPRHVGIIMDGNGRWAKSRGLKRSLGHVAGTENVIEIVRASKNLGIESLTLYAFSTENWKRPLEEVNSLMKLIKVFINREIRNLEKENVKLNIFGDIGALPKEVYETVIGALDITDHCNGMNLNIALNYGSRQEILRASLKLHEDLLNGKIIVENVDCDVFSKYLYSKNQADVDLLIRPSGEMRLSNFMLYQIAYAELVFCDCLWPDFGKDELISAITEYQRRSRRFGGL